MKYTSMIDLGSRPTLPRVDMTPLATYLNIVEKEEKSEGERTKNFEQLSESYHRMTGTEMMSELGDRIIPENVGRSEEVTQSLHWHCDRITDSGPILRLNSDVNKLSKAARYGHPYERPIYSSSISPSEMKEIVFSFFSYAYSGGTDGRVKPKKDHEWCDLHEFNKRIDWSLWRPSPYASSSIPTSQTEALK